MEWLVENQELVAGAVVALAGVAFLALKKIAKLTETKVDDQIVELIEAVQEEADND